MRPAVLKTVALLAIISSFGLSACNPTLRTHGYVPTEADKPQEIEPGADIRPITEERQITAIVFNEDGQVNAVAEYGLEDGRVVNFVGRETPTRGRELSVLEQIFGTIGRLPTDTLTRDSNQPGGGGGPGSGR